MQTLEDFQQISEEAIRERAAKTGSKNFDRLLAIADAWRECELTPVFILLESDDDTHDMIACVAKERFDSWLN